ISARVSPMSEQKRPDDPSSAGSDQPAARGTIFDQPAPAGAAKKTSEVLGEIVWLMSQSPLHKQLFISDLERLVMTPMLLQRFRLSTTRASRSAWCSGRA